VLSVLVLDKRCAVCVGVRQTLCYCSDQTAPEPHTLARNTEILSRNGPTELLAAVTRVKRFPVESRGFNCDESEFAMICLLAAGCSSF
jgi:hypothetical protein